MQASSFLNQRNLTSSCASSVRMSRTISRFQKFNLIFFNLIFNVFNLENFSTSFLGRDISFNQIQKRFKEPEISCAVRRNIISNLFQHKTPSLYFFWFIECFSGCTIIPARRDATSQFRSINKNFPHAAVKRNFFFPHAAVRKLKIFLKILSLSNS